MTCLRSRGTRWKIYGRKWFITGADGAASLAGAVGDNGRMNGVEQELGVVGVRDRDQHPRVAQHAPSCRQHQQHDQAHADDRTAWAQTGLPTGNQHRYRCSADPASRSGGSSVRHLSCATGQRGLNLHPAGGSTRSGGRPGITESRVWFGPASGGTDAGRVSRLRTTAGWHADGEGEAGCRGRQGR